MLTMHKPPSLIALASLLLISASSPNACGAELRVGELRVGKILFLGNSITLHAPAPNIGWTGNWGMAATTKDRDYVHVLLSRIAEAAGGKPEIKVKNIAEFERNLSAYNLKNELKEELAFEADLVIIAIGENATSPKTDEQKLQFETAFRDLLTELKRHGQPTIFVRSQFWQDTDKDKLMNRCSQATDAIFVDISRLGQEETNYARSEQKIEHSGVAGHPGDRGMQALADALWHAMREYAQQEKK